MENRPLLEVKNLNKVYGAKKNWFYKTNGYQAVKDVSFSITKGESFGLIGESGSGKSTIGRMILRLTKASAGTVFYKDKPLFELSPKQMESYRSKMQIVFQDSGSAFNPRMTIGEQIAYPLLKQKKAAELTADQKVASLLEKVGLRKNYAARYPHELSGGQRQRAGIARALIVNPEFLVLDEPVSALDVSVKAQIINLLKELQEEFNLTYLFIAHNLDLVAYFCDRVGVLSEGELIETASTIDLFRHPKHEVTKKLLKSILTLNGDFDDFRESFHPALKGVVN
jgi:peptide/nickel transport system ATP-binding protein/oligopeptide transport system ATP-binding protein